MEKAVNCDIEKVLNYPPNKSYTMVLKKGFVARENSSYGGTISDTYYLCDDSCKKVYITKVLYNNPATVVFWSDGTQTRNICPKNTLYNPDAGLAFCVLKKFMGGDEMAKLFNDWECEDYREDKNHWVELKDVRKKHKELKDEL